MTLQSFAKLEVTINNWLLISDLGLIKIIVAIVLANRLPAEPVWLLIVAPPGGAKTELLRGLYGLKSIYPISDLTTQTFLSGDRSNPKASLLQRLPPEVIIVLKDFTTVLAMHPDKRSAILSQLREIYDGDFRKEFGTGESKSWQGKMGFIAGVTSVIDKHQTVHQTLGERFIQYRPSQPDPLELSMRAISNGGNEKEMREEIQSAFVNYIENVKLPKKPIEPPADYKQRIGQLSVFCCRARSGIVRDGYSREIELIPEVELPTRLAKQYMNLFNGLALISGEYTLDDYRLVYKIALDSLPAIRRSIIEYLAKTKGSRLLAEVAEAIGYPPNTTRRSLEDLVALKIVSGTQDGTSLSYKLRSDIRATLTKAHPQASDLAEKVNRIFFDGKGLPDKSEGTKT